MNEIQKPTQLTDEQFAALLVGYTRLVHKFARRYSPDGHDPEDVAQAALLAAWRRRRAFQGDRPTKSGRPPIIGFLIWAVRSVSRHLSHRVRRPKGVTKYELRERHVPTDPRGVVLCRLTRGEGDDPAAPLHAAEVVEKVTAAVGKLAEKQRTAVEARMAGKKWHQIDATVSKQAVQHRFSHAVEGMRKQLAEAFGIE